jgi:hypothetical protein
MNKTFTGFILLDPRIQIQQTGQFFFSKSTFKRLFVDLILRLKEDFMNTIWIR